MLFGKKLKPKTLNEQELKALFFALEALNKWVLELGEGHKLEIERFDVPTRWVEDERVVVSGRIRIYRYRGSLHRQGYWSEIPEMVRFQFATLPKCLDRREWERHEKDQTYFNLTHEGTGVSGSFFEYSARYSHIGLRHDANRLNQMINHHLNADKKKKAR